MKAATLALALVALVGPGRALAAAPERAPARTNAPRLLDFHADWCEPCRQMRPKVAELAKRGYPVESIDIDENPDKAARYGVRSIPTFIVVDGSGKALARTQGAVSAAALAALYRSAQDKLADAADRSALTREDEESSREPAAGDDSDSAERPSERASAAASDDETEAPANPRPWETVVRIQVHGNGMIGYGSGTVIDSTPDESLILTCAHIFHVEGAPDAVNPKRFPLKVTVDLFDGRLRDFEHPVVQCSEKGFEARVLDFNPKDDVGLIVIRPGRRLPASRVVSPGWKPKVDMDMTTVGCSEGHDATAWSTKITRISGIKLSGKPSYSAIECKFAPKQGRSGGGLYTQEGYLAGVCNFAFSDPRHPRGLYASPESIYKILDRNKLTMLYDANAKSELLASRGRPNIDRVKMRGQSPDDETSSGKRLSLPPHSFLGLRTNPDSASRPMTKRTGWQPSQPSRVRDEPTVPSGDLAENRSFRPALPEDPSLPPRSSAVTTDLQIDESAGDADEPAPSRRAADQAKGGWRSARD